MRDSSGAELPAALRRRTTFAIVRLAGDFRRRLNEELAQVGVSQHQHAILCCLAEFGAAFQKDVAARLGIDTGDTVALVEGLERAGLITRQRDPRDRRRQILEITELGTAALLRIEETMDRVEREELITLSDQDRAALHDAAVRALTHHTPGAWPADNLGRAGASLPEPTTTPLATAAQHDAASDAAGQLRELLHLLAVVPRAALTAGRSLLAPLDRRIRG
jgi:DNA-binding MarR family transcriptional regulator